jgi:hypothetical protein
MAEESEAVDWRYGISLREQIDVAARRVLQVNGSMEHRICRASLNISFAVCGRRERC